MDVLVLGLDIVYHLTDLKILEEVSKISVLCTVFCVPYYIPATHVLIF